MSERPKVVIADFIAGPLETERRVLGEMADIVALDADTRRSWPARSTMPTAS